MVDELPRVYKCDQSPDKQGYTELDMDLEIQRVAREMYKAFNGLNDGFKEVFLELLLDHNHLLFLVTAQRSGCYRRTQYTY